MSLLVLLYVAAAVCVFGNAYCIARIARMPAHLRWELYPMPRGTAEQQRYGGSYFENTDWWTKPRSTSAASEMAYIAREVATFNTVWKRNRSLWLWSWLMHIGLYALIATTAAVLFSAVTLTTSVPTIQAAALTSSFAGLAGVAGLLARRFGNNKLRAYTSRADAFNLLLIGALFASESCVHFSPYGTQGLITFTRAFLRIDSPTAVSWSVAVHISIIAVFLAYFPATHMTHAYMKFFTYHRVRWDDAPLALDVALERSLASNIRRPISWAAPHIASTEKSTWVDVVGESKL